MKFRNIFFGFLRTWLLIAIFCSSSLYAGINMILMLQDYQYTVADFPPYFLRENPLNAGNFIKVLEEQNAFQFKTYNLNLEADFESYEAEVKPILIEWSEKIGLLGENAELSKNFSGLMKAYVGEDFRSSSQEEIHIATYKGKIEAISYVKDTTEKDLEIDLLVANPNGLVENQTMLPKGGGSSLLDYMVHKYEEEGVEKIQLYSVNDEYYFNRGWQIEPEPEGACGGVSK
ncbi:hypothetical protein MS2017_1535 [Bathymodiolus thermophilus thioautotrophic gill symbiont]|uniref:Uncharacterized protein n=1 Tax=Bathymodiolus thermophilus thioautotrophic gill symbiont TaxID=2360 RepID=A0A3G3IN53_9GAMM|nr:hypothetical protein [Bathymodiolus thermophilus thioautotrophic gill symbiont]AYQ57220.1 hypothetical protein MS2017_1535 [Bathymodiolus thermophilus thioautotrophic gill symbiont]